MGAVPKPKQVVVPMRTLSDKEALAWLIGKGRLETSAAALGRDWRWDSKKVKSHLDRWSSAGHIEVTRGLAGRTVITARSGGAPAVANLPTGALGPRVVSGAALMTADPAAVEETPAAATATAAVASAPVTTDAATDGAVRAVSSAVVTEFTGPPDEEPVASARPAAPAPTLRPGPAPEPPAPKAAALPAEMEAAPEPATTRAPVVDTPPPAPQVWPVAASVSATPMPASVVEHPRGSGFVNALAYLVAVALAGIAAFFSISGMIVLFPGAPTAIVIMGVVMESAKLVTVAFLAHQWRTLAWLSRLVLVVLVAGLAAINAAGVYSQLVAAHFGNRVAAESDVQTEAAALAAKTEMQTQTVADLDRRVAQIDGAITEMTRRGRASGALAAIARQRREREALAAQRRREAETLVALKTDAAAVAARDHKIEVESAPIRYVAQLLGASTEEAIRFLILLMVLTCDPLAVALTAAASRPRWRR